MSPKSKIITMCAVPLVLIVVFVLVAPFKITEGFINRQTGHYRQTITYFMIFKASDRLHPEGLIAKNGALTAPDVEVLMERGTWGLFTGRHDGRWETIPRGKRLLIIFYRLFEFRNRKEYSIPDDLYKDMYQKRLALWNSDELETVSDERINALRDEADNLKIKKTP